MAKTSLLKKAQEEHLEGEVGPARRGTGPRRLRYRGFQDRTLYSHPDGRGLTVSTDSCKLYNKLYCTCLYHNSDCYNQTYVCIEYL